MKSQVFFADLRTTISKNMTKKINRLMRRTEVGSIIGETDLVAIKLHFGEKGNTAFVRPIFIRDIVENIYSCGGKPFLTDSNTLYRGERGEAVSHLKIALTHGFNLTTVSAPVIVADGLRGNDAVKVKIDGKHLTEVSIGSAVIQADVLIGVAHFKGHELTGFGGALKNIGMGCASKEGKLKQHSNISPQVKAKQCSACGRCMEWCPADAIGMVNEKSRIDAEKCIGCAECITICPKGAIGINWNEGAEVFQEKMVEHVHGVIKNKKKKSLFINFLTDISPACDCYGHADRPIVPDIGILASLDPVATDQASVDLVNAEQGLTDSALKNNHGKGKDKFRGLYPEVDWEIQLDYGQKLGIGSRDYELIKV